MNQSISMREDGPGQWVSGFLSYFLLIAFLAVGTVSVFRAVALGLGDLSSPGVGLWPFVLGIALLIMCVAYAVSLVRGDSSFVFPLTKGFKYAMGLGSASLVLGIALPIVGYLVALTALGLLVCRWVGAYSWSKSLTIAVVSAGAVYAVFVVGLNIRMPLFP